MRLSTSTPDVHRRPDETFPTADWTSVDVRRHQNLPESSPGGRRSEVTARLPPRKPVISVSRNTPPSAPPQTTSTSTSGELSMTPLAVQCGESIGTCTVRTRRSMIVGEVTCGDGGGGVGPVSHVPPPPLFAVRRLAHPAASPSGGRSARGRAADGRGTLGVAPAPTACTTRTRPDQAGVSTSPAPCEARHARHASRSRSWASTSRSSINVPCVM